MADRLNGQTAEEQAALRRVAMLVARGVASETVFAAVAEEVAALFAADIVAIVRHEPDGESIVVSGHGLAHFKPGTRFKPDPRAAGARAWQPGRAIRFDADDPGAYLPREMRMEGARSSVSAPILVEGRTWGLIGVGSRRGRLPSYAGQRLASFTELAATAVANAQAHAELRGFAEEQAALGRVATLVAQGAPPEDVFTAVTDEAGRLLQVDYTVLSRYDPDGLVTIVGAWASTEPGRPLPIGLRVKRGGRNIHALVFETGHSARVDDYDAASGAIADVARDWDYRASAGVPVWVEGKPWGVMSAGSRSEPLPAGTEERLDGFTELAATAIANAQARKELREFAQEQAALRRVAMLVGRSAPPAEVFASIAEETGRLLDAEVTGMSRYDPDGTLTLLGTWARSGAAVPVPVGARFGPGGHNTGTLVFQTGQPARIDDFGEVTGPVGRPARELLDASAAVGVPVSVEGRLWGIVSVMSTRAPFPADTEVRLCRFTELAATAIANAEARAALTASRARIVAAVDAARRRIERDLHDAAEQQLVSLALQLRAMQAAAPPDSIELLHGLETVTSEANDVLAQVREIAGGLHPSVLADGGLRPALMALVHRSAIPVQLNVRVEGRLPEPAELTAYYAVSEALTNTAKHAHASAAEVEVAADQDMLRVRVRDDGDGGADSSRGSGLTGLRDRIEAIGGHIALRSPPGAGTAMEIALPLRGTAPAAS
ncbi:MAG TPA: GAF domain-containing protein [Trebonia sp.]